MAVLSKRYGDMASKILQRGKKGIWWYRGYWAGREYFFSLKTTDEHLAIREQRDKDMLLDTDTPTDNKRLNPTLDAFWAEYEDWANDHKRPATVETERVWWDQLKRVLDPKRMGDVRRADVEKFKKELSKAGAKGKPLKPVSINGALRHLQALYNLAIKHNLYTGENPFVGVKRLEVHHVNPDFLDANEIKALLDAAKAHSQSIYWCCLLGIYAGLRKNEIVNARWEWFDVSNPNEPLIHVAPHEGFSIKNHTARDIPMSRRIREAIVAHSEGKGFLFESGRMSDGKSRYRYDPKRAFNTVKHEAGVPRANFNLLRHTFGSQHVKAGTSIFKVKNWMGHSSVVITERHYAGQRGYDEDIDRF